jgi:hypothetical protein
MAAALSFGVCVFFNHQTSMPNRMPFSSSSAVIFGGFVPSGIVPGDGVAARDWKQRRDCGPGPDCFSFLCFRVMYAKEEALVVFLFFRRSSM